MFLFILLGRVWSAIPPVRSKGWDDNAAFVDSTHQTTSHHRLSTANSSKPKQAQQTTALHQPRCRRQCAAIASRARSAAMWSRRAQRILPSTGSQHTWRIPPATSGCWIFNRMAVGNACLHVLETTCHVAAGGKGRKSKDCVVCFGPKAFICWVRVDGKASNPFLLLQPRGGNRETMESLPWRNTQILVEPSQKCGKTRRIASQRSTVQIRMPCITTIIAQTADPTRNER
jgi:hypothetical protein